MTRQPRAVWAVAFAAVVAFMGIGLVDPILAPIAENLDASPSQVSLLFTSYMAVMGVAMLVTGTVAHRIGAKRTLLLGLTVIVAGAALAGASDTVSGIVGWRALWGLGNALFIATALATIVSASRGSVAQAVILYEAALGLGIAVGPLIGGALGSVSWRGPFFGVSVLMVVAVGVTAVLLPATPPTVGAVSLLDPLRALRDRGLFGISLTALLYNVGFFTLLAYTPFPLGFGAQQVGAVFFGWGLAVAVTSVVVAPRLQRRFGTVATLTAALLAFAATLAAMALGTGRPPVLAAGVVVAGLFIGVANTLVTETVMTVPARIGASRHRPGRPVDRATASAAYSFMRFAGAAVAPWLATTLGERVDVHLPFWLGAAAVVLAAAVLAATRRPGADGGAAGDGHTDAPAVATVARHR